jgi:hypothetical protein
MKAQLEFISEMSKSERRELESRLYVLIEHVLKIQYIGGRVAADNLRGWSRTVRDQRRELLSLFVEHPGIKPELSYELIDEIYRTAIADLKKEFPNLTLPGVRQLSIEDIVGASVMRATLP